MFASSVTDSKNVPPDDLRQHSALLLGRKVVVHEACDLLRRHGTTPISVELIVSQLRKLHEAHSDEMEVLAFPCAQFLNQEPQAADTIGARETRQLTVEQLRSMLS